MFAVCEVVLGGRLELEDLSRANPRLDGILANEDMKSVSINRHKIGILIFKGAGYTTVSAI